MAIQDSERGLITDIDALREKIQEFEIALGRIDKLTSRNSKSIADLIIRLGRAVLAGGLNDTSVKTDLGSFRFSQGQALADAAAAILRASRRNS